MIPQRILLPVGGGGRTVSAAHRPAPHVAARA